MRRNKGVVEAEAQETEETKNCLVLYSSVLDFSVPKSPLSNFPYALQ